MRRTIITVSAAVGLLAVGFACSSPRERTDDAGRPVGRFTRTDRTAVPPRPGDHWVLNDRLRAVMTRIDRQPVPQPVKPQDQGRQRETPDARNAANDSFLEAVALADGLANAAAGIPRSVADHPMSGEDRRGFTTEADRLRQQSLALRRAARSRRVGDLHRALDQISATCASCHSQYKDFAGELGSSAAAGR